MSVFLNEIKKLFGPVADARAAWRADGMNEREIAKATERMVRHHLDPLTAPLEQWPEWMLRGRCAYCDGTGLVIHKGVTNRLRIEVDEGFPCSCPLGARFIDRQPPTPDHTQAGKVTKPKVFSRFGR